jgi:hypothetical protein
MERNRSEVSSEESSSQMAMDEEEQNAREGVLAWWYRLFAPPEPPGVASLAQREKARRGRIASIAMLISILFLLAILLLAVLGKDYEQTAAICVGIGGSIVALFLNRKGSIKAAGVLVLMLMYAGEVFPLFTYSGGLTANNIFMLDFTVIPDVIVLAFFSANVLLPIVCLNVLLTWALVVFGPHDAVITNMVYHAPLQIFAHVYILQLVIASTLYLWAHSTEIALRRADRAEEIIALEKRENERKQLELEQKSQLDTGIQQILQTHVAVANGDLSARAPLSQDHMLWQVAMSLNNLIARLQSLSHTENELRQQIWEGNERVTGPQRALLPEAGRTTGAQKSLHPEAGRTTGAQKALHPETGRTTGAQKALRSEAGRTTGAQKALRSGAEGTTGARKALHPEAGGTTGAQKTLRSEPGGTGGRLKALRLEQEGGADHEKETRPEPGGITGAQKALHPEPGDTTDDGYRRGERAALPFSDAGKEDQ